MKSKLFIVLVIAACLCLSACTERSADSSQSSENTPSSVINDSQKSETKEEQVEENQQPSENESIQILPETEDNLNNLENTQSSELEEIPSQEGESDDATTDGAKTTKRADVSCSVQGSMTGIIDGETVELSLDVPANWEQSDTATTFYHEDGSKVAVGFWATIVPEGQTIWSTAKVNLVPGYVSSKMVNINGQEVLLSIDFVPWDKNEEEPPEDQKEYCYDYHIPYQNMYITIQIYAVGKDNEEAMQLHREILESIEFH